MVQKNVLWLRYTHPDTLKRNGISSEYKKEEDSFYDDIAKCRPPVHIRRLPVLLKNSLMVGQEVILGCYLLAWHRTLIARESSHPPHWEAEYARFVSTTCLSLALLLVATITSRQSITTRDKVRQRLLDTLLVGFLLRIMSAVLKTLTASYSSDTVLALSISSIMLHLLTCDFTYATGVRAEHEFGHGTNKPMSEKRALSLNAVFLAATLLASRMRYNTSAFAFIYLAVILFALYPDARHHFARRTRTAHQWAPILVTILFSVATYFLLDSKLEIYGFIGLLFVICCLSPMWKYWLQHYKRPFKGPWDPFRL